MYCKRPAAGLIPGLLVAGLYCCGALAETPIANPYWAAPVWKLWSRDPASVTSGTTVVAAPATTNRLYPDDADATAFPGRFLAYRTNDWAERKYFGSWDDVYVSFDSNANGTPHSWIRSGWSGKAGNAVNFAGKLMTAHQPYRYDNVKIFGMTFTSQSTTGMGHDIANSSSNSGPECIPGIEKDWYFANCLRAGPAHISHRDNNFYWTDDLYQAMSPCFYNSVGSSGTETAALTKMLIAGSYLPRELKPELKRNGLYIATLLYLWKAGLPYDVPYDNELRHRVAYASDGAYLVPDYIVNRPFYLYDDTAHLSNMVAMAKTMTVAPPIALLKRMELQSGTQTYFTRTTALFQQASNETVRVRISTGDSFDLQGRPLTFRWKQLYGSTNVTIRQEGSSDTYQITVPYDARLPRGRTSILLIANNGIYDSNPACVNVYKTVGAVNRRPTLEGLEDRIVLPGETATCHIVSSDPEGFPVVLYRRSGEVGTLAGNTFTWATSTNTPAGAYPVAVIASDGTGGYNSKEITITVAQTIAQAAAEPVSGAVRLPVRFSSAGSRDRQGHTLAYLWEFDDGTTSAATNPSHTFADPGVYRVRLTANGPLGTHSNQVFVEARNPWPLRIDNGWTNAGVDPAVWNVIAPSNGTLVVSGGKLRLNRGAGLFSLQSVETLPPPLYLEADFTKNWANTGDGFEVMGAKIGWDYNSSSPLCIRNLITSNKVNIGMCLSNPTLEKAQLRVYVTGDPLHPGKVRFSGCLEGLMGKRFFRVEDQASASDSIRVIDTFAGFDIYRLQVWAPDPLAQKPPDGTGMRRFL